MERAHHATQLARLACILLAAVALGVGCSPYSRYLRTRTDGSSQTWDIIAQTLEECGYHYDEEGSALLDSGLRHPSGSNRLFVSSQEGNEVSVLIVTRTVHGDTIEGLQISVGGMQHNLFDTDQDRVEIDRVADALRARLGTRIVEGAERVP